MDEEEFDLSGFEGFNNKQPKDLKRSIRDKYNVRLRFLAHALDDFIMHAEGRLDEDRAGKIRNKAETEELIKTSKDLRDLLPISKQDQIELPEELYKNLCGFFNIPYGGEEE